MNLMLLLGVLAILAVLSVVALLVAVVVTEHRSERRLAERLNWMHLRSQELEREADARTRDTIREGRDRTQELIRETTARTQEWVRESAERTQALIQESKNRSQEFSAEAGRVWKWYIKTERRDRRLWRQSLLELRRQHEDTDLLIRMLLERTDRERGGPGGAPAGPAPA